MERRFLIPANIFAQVGLFFAFFLFNANLLSLRWSFLALGALLLEKIGVSALRALAEI